MSQPIFVVGPQRSGTSILARTICRADGVADRHFNPCSRWDIPAMAELGGKVGITPWLDRMDEWLADRPERYAVVRFALPWAVESFGWPRLAKGRPKAQFVFIYRNPVDTYTSWRELAYLPPEALVYPEMSYRHWYYDLYQIHERPTLLIGYERLVEEGPIALSAMWRVLGLPAPDLPDDWFHKPKHWSGDSA